jgi:mannose-6-phosphate isomerase
LDAVLRVRYGASFAYSEQLTRGQTMVLPAALGCYCLEGTGTLLCTYVPAPGDEAWQLWEKQNSKEIGL